MGALLFMAEGSAQNSEVSQKRKVAQSQHVQTPELLNRINIARTLLREDNLEKSESLIRELMGQYPYEGELYMLQGDIMMRRQQPVEAMYAYREAIQLNPDFLDKKTEAFQGKKIKNTVNEAMTAIETALQTNPEDSRLQDDREVGYYMKRKIAGSCG